MIDFILHVFTIWDLEYQIFLQYTIFTPLGVTRLGLTEICVLFEGQPESEEKCEALALPSYWSVTLIFIVIGIFLNLLTLVLLLISMCRPTSERMIRVLGFLASKSLSQYFNYFSINCIYFKGSFWPFRNNEKNKICYRMSSQKPSQKWLCLNNHAIYSQQLFFLLYKLNLFFNSITKNLVLFFCVACIVFPFGFNIEEIGGEPYKLPHHTEVGNSYYYFVGSVFSLTVAVTLCNLDVIRDNFPHRHR